MKERIALWDNLKFLLIFFVVIGHFAEQVIDSGTQTGPYRAIFIFIYAFHMPLFIFVSGLFHKNKNISQKVFAFISIGLIYKVLIYCIRRVTEGEASFKLLQEGGIPWFMFVLAVFILLAYLLRNVNPRLVLVVSVVLACFAGYDSSIGDFLCLSRIIVFFPFYFAGTMVNRVKLEELSRKKSMKILGLIILIVWALLCVLALPKVYLLRPLMTGKNAFCKVDLPYVILFRILCYAIAAVLGLAWILFVPTKRIFAVTTIGQRTMQIYFWHRPLIYIIVNLGLANSLFGNVVGQGIWMLIGVAATFVLAWKPLRYPTDLFLNFRSAPPVKEPEPTLKS